MKRPFIVYFVGVIGAFHCNLFLSVALANPLALSLQSDCQPFALRAAYETLLKTKKTYEVGEEKISFGPTTEILSTEIEVGTKNDFIIRIKFRANSKKYFAKTAVNVPGRHQRMCNNLAVGWSGTNDFVVQEEK